MERFRLWFTKNWSLLLVGVMVLVYTVVFSYLSIARHNAFASGFDLGNMDQTVWNTLHKNFYALTSNYGTVSRFSIHADPILIMFAPLYLLWDNVRVLLILQSLFIGLSAFPIYFLSRKIIKKNMVSVALAAIFLLVPGIQWSNIYDFHPNTIEIFLFLCVAYFAWTKRWRWYFLAGFFMLLCKETATLTLGAFGVLLFIFHKEYKVGLITVFVSISWFILMVGLVIPYFSPEHRYWALSWVQGIDVSENNSFSLRGEYQILSKFLLANDAQVYYIQLLKPYFFLPLLGLPWVLVVLPRLFINLISSQAQMRSIYFHYDSVIQAGLIFSTIFAFKYILQLLKKIKIPSLMQKLTFYVIVLLCLVVTLRVNYHYSPLPTTPGCWCIMYNVTDEDRQFDKLLQTIPQSAVVTASPEIKPHISHRENAYTVPAATSSADYIALIDQNRLVGDYNPKVYELELIKQLDTSNTYSLVKHLGHFYLYKRNGAPSLL